MRRRDFVAGLGVVTISPVVARAAQQPMPVIGCADVETIASGEASFLPAFRKRMAANGFVEGNKNFRFASRKPSTNGIIFRPCFASWPTKR
jgi:hypothetical protein